MACPSTSAAVLCMCMLATALAGPGGTIYGKASTDPTGYQAYGASGPCAAWASAGGAVKVKKVYPGPTGTGACDNSLATTELFPLPAGNNMACVSWGAADTGRRGEMQGAPKSAYYECTSADSSSCTLSTYSDTACTERATNPIQTMCNASGDVPNTFPGNIQCMFSGYGTPPNYDSANANGVCHPLGPQLTTDEASARGANATVDFVALMEDVTLDDTTASQIASTGASDITLAESAFGFQREVTIGETPAISGSAGYYWLKKYSVKTCREITKETPFSIQTFENECISVSSIRKFAPFCKMMKSVANHSTENAGNFTQDEEAGYDALIDSDDADHLYIGTRCCKSGPVMATFTDNKCTKMAHGAAVELEVSDLLKAARNIYFTQIRSTDKQGCHDTEDESQISGAFIGGGCPVTIEANKTDDKKQNCTAVQQKYREQKKDLKTMEYQLAAPRLAVVYTGDCPSSTSNSGSGY